MVKIGPLMLLESRGDLDVSFTTLTLGMNKIEAYKRADFAMIYEVFALVWLGVS